MKKPKVFIGFGECEEIDKIVGALNDSDVECITYEQLIECQKSIVKDYNERAKWIMENGSRIQFEGFNAMLEIKEPKKPKHQDPLGEFMRSRRKGCNRY